MFEEVKRKAVKYLLKHKHNRKIIQIQINKHKILKKYLSMINLRKVNKWIVLESEEILNLFH